MDGEGFEHALEVQRGKSRESQAFEGKQGREFEYTSDEARRELFETGDQFEGYTTTRVAGVPILALFDVQQRQVSTLRAGESGYVMIERTPFYHEAGGQVSDSGRICSDAPSGEAAVIGMTRLGPSGPRAHRVRVISGSLNVADLVTAEVDEPLRDSTRRNHTATHLLHAALRRVLGSHVKQAGSLVAPDRLRFDFAHFAALTRDELDQIERLANEQIYANRPVQTEIRSTQEAMVAGAMALFGEKYGDRVRVVSVPGFSMELCGGTHCRATGDIGALVIVQETGIAAGVRRIEALTGAGAVRHLQHRRATLDRLLQALNTPEDQALDAVERLRTDTKRLAREVSDLKLKAAVGVGEPTSEAVIELAGARILARRVSGLEKAALRGLADSLKARAPSGVVVLASETDGKVVVVVSVTKDLTRAAARRQDRQGDRADRRRRRRRPGRLRGSWGRSAPEDRRAAGSKSGSRQPDIEQHRRAGQVKSAPSDSNTSSRTLVHNHEGHETPTAIVIGCGTCIESTCSSSSSSHVWRSARPARRRSTRG